MVVIGADTHKCSHALAGVDEGTGRVRGQREIKAVQPGHLAAVRWARDLDEDRVWAIEDCRAASRRFEQALLAAGMELRLLLDHRNDLVADRARTVNRPRWHLLQLCPELERSVKRGSFKQSRVLDRSTGACGT
jgi:hypothetical protein